MTGELAAPIPMKIPWQKCRFLSCSVLPVRMACNLSCPFCFSKSSISTLQQDHARWQEMDLRHYYRFAENQGANRLVITGGGEPLLKPEDVLHLVKVGSEFFSEIALFTNGTFLTAQLAESLRDAGLSYLCFSRHHFDDDLNRNLMGTTAPTLDHFFTAARNLKVRATCVLNRKGIEKADQVWKYIDTLVCYGVTEFTFKHTYVAYSHSVFAGTRQDIWAAEHQVQKDPFSKQGTVIAQLPWGPEIRRIGPFQVCYYFEPTPEWEQEQGLCRSTNLLSDGSVYASLEDQRSLLFQLM